MFIGINVDESAKLKHQIISTQSMPEGMCEKLNINVSIRFKYEILISVYTKKVYFSTN
jgi:hypothetical protein